MLTGLLYWLLIGFVAYSITAFLDEAMDYGMIFGFVRASFVRNSRLPFDEHILFEDRFAEICCLPDFEERMQLMAELYWNYAVLRGWFVVLLCRTCLSAYVVFFIWGIVSLYGGSFLWIGLLYAYGGNYLAHNLLK